MLEGQLSLAALDPCPADCHPYGETLIASFPFHRDAEAVSGLPAIADGTYTTFWTKEDAARSGWEDNCPSKSDGAHFTLVLNGGHFRQLEGCAGTPDKLGDAGSYTSTADRFAMTSDCCPGAATFAWTLAGDVLTLRVLDVADPTASLAILHAIYDHDWTPVP